MPIYEYKCSKCGKEFEEFQKITDEEITTCRYCKGPVNRLVSLSSFHLKGSGWYVTDYGGKKQTASVPEQKSESTTADTSKTDAAPAASDE